MGIVYRILVAAVVVAILWVVIPPFFRILGFAGSADLLFILRACIGGLALLYVLTGNRFFPSPPA